MTAAHLLARIDTKIKPIGFIYFLVWTLSPVASMCNPSGLISQPFDARAVKTYFLEINDDLISPYGACYYSISEKDAPDACGFYARLRDGITEIKLNMSSPQLFIYYSNDLDVLIKVGGPYSVVLRNNQLWFDVPLKLSGTCSLPDDLSEKDFNYLGKAYKVVIWMSDENGKVVYTWSDYYSAPSNGFGFFSFPNVNYIAEYKSKTSDNSIFVDLGKSSSKRGIYEDLHAHRKWTAKSWSFGGGLNGEQFPPPNSEPKELLKDNANSPTPKP
ncbi:MAG: hypothetical protein U1F77_09375 [Kiritimatiellia bacterium]